MQDGLNAPPIRAGSFTFTGAAGNRSQTATLEIDPAVVDARMVAVPDDTLQQDLSALSLDEFLSSDHPELYSRDIENRLLRQELASLRDTLTETQAAAVQGRAAAIDFAEAVKLDTQEKAKEALEFQNRNFETKASEYQEAARDICQTEVAQAKAVLEADAFSALGQKDQEIAGLASTLQFAENIANEEAQQKELLFKQARETLDRQEAEASRVQEEKTKALENQAQENHLKILKEREASLRSEAATLVSNTALQAELKVNTLEQQNFLLDQQTVEYLNTLEIAQCKLTQVEEQAESKLEIAQ